MIAASLEMIEVVSPAEPRISRSDVLGRLRAGQITADEAVAQLEGR